MLSKASLSSSQANVAQLSLPLLLCCEVRRLEAALESTCSSNLQGLPLSLTAIFGQSSETSGFLVFDSLPTTLVKEVVVVVEIDGASTVTCASKMTISSFEESQFHSICYVLISLYLEQVSSGHCGQ